MSFFRGFPAADICALFEEPNATGDALDINAARNAPAKTPGPYLDSIHLHSRFNYFVPAAGFPKTVTVNHIAYGADAGTTFGALTAYVSHASKDYTLVAHGQGGIPLDWLGTFNGQEYPIGCPIQVGENGGRRNVSFWCDATNIYVHEDVKPGISGLPAISVTYEMVVFRLTNDEAGLPLAGDFSGGVQFGRGRIKSTERTLREMQPGDAAPFSIPTGPCGDAANGHFRFVLDNMLTYDVGPLMGKNTYTGAFWGGAQKKLGLPS